MGSLVKEKGRVNSLGLLQLPHSSVLFKNMAAELFLAFSNWFHSLPLNSSHLLSSFSFFPNKTLLIARIIVAFSLFSSWWGLELVDKTDLAWDLGWSLSSHKECTPWLCSCSALQRGLLKIGPGDLGRWPLGQRARLRADSLEIGCLPDSLGRSLCRKCWCCPCTAPKTRRLVQATDC